MARPKKTDGEIKDQRVPIVMSEAELRQLDDWMHENRIRSRGEAIRRLCQLGYMVTNNAHGLQSDLLLIFDRYSDLAETIKSSPDSEVSERFELLSRALSTYSLVAMPQYLAATAIVQGEDFDSAMEGNNKVWTSVLDILERAGLTDEEGEKDG